MPKALAPSAVGAAARTRLAARPTDDEIFESRRDEARQQIVLFKDDLDGSEKDVRTISFRVREHHYEIDLGPKNHAKLQRVLGPFIEAGTKVASRGRTSARRGPARSAGGAQREFNVRVRDWAAANGYEVKPRGRIPEPVLDAFHKAGKK